MTTEEKQQQLEEQQLEEQRRKEEQEEKAQKRRKRIIKIMILIIIILLLITSCTVFMRYGTPLTPDYPPQGIEENQTPLDGDESDKMLSPDGGGAINVTYALDATVSLSQKTVTLYYANPYASNQNVALLILIDDLVVAKTDMITPGHKVTVLPLENYARTKLMEGGYDAELVVRAYDPDSGEKAMIDTKGQLKLTVVE